MRPPKADKLENGAPRTNPGIASASSGGGRRLAEALRRRTKSLNQEETMERTAVRSRDIAIVGYNPSTSTLEVAFRNGAVYHYTDVPAEVHKSLMAASSH